MMHSNQWTLGHLHDAWATKKKNKWLFGDCEGVHHGLFSPGKDSVIWVKIPVDAHHLENGISEDLTSETADATQ